MSWSIGFIGSAAKVADAITAHSSKLDGPSKTEYDSAVPHLVGLVNQNFENGHDAVVKITANGHGYFVEGKQQSGTCQVTIERFYGSVV